MYFYYISGPTNIGHHQFRTINMNQRPLLETPYLRDIEQLRRKTALSQISSNNNTNNISSNTNSNASIEQCQGYKLNAPQIQGELYFAPGILDNLLKHLKQQPRLRSKGYNYINWRVKVCFGYLLVDIRRFCWFLNRHGMQFPFIYKKTNKNINASCV